MALVENPNPHKGNERGEMSLKELLLKVGEWSRYLLSKWLVILFFGAIGAVVGFLYAYTKEVSYTATTTFVLEDEKGGGGLGSLAGLASIAGVDIAGGGGGIFQGDNILELYKSRSMIEKTLLTPIEGDTAQLLVERYIQFNKLREQWAKIPALKNLKFPRYDQLTVNRLQDSVLGSIVYDINKNYLSVGKPDKKLSIIQVNVKAKDEQFAKAFNNQIVRNVNDFYIQTKTKKSLDNVSILQHKTDSVRAVMNGAIYNAVAVADATPNLNPTRQIQRTAPAQRFQFSAETNRAVLGEMVKNLEMSKMAALKETPLIQVVDEPVFPLEKSKLSKLKALIIGGVLSGFLACMVLLFRKLLKTSLSE